MTDITPSDHGIVVDHKDNGLRYAVSDRNYNPKVHRKVRDLKPGESVRTYRPKVATSSQGSADPQGDPSTPAGATAEPTDGSATRRTTPGPQASTQTEGSASAASQDKKEGN